MKFEQDGTVHGVVFSIPGQQGVSILGVDGAPLGSFTWEDVDALSPGHPQHDVYHPGRPCCDSELRHRILGSLADRIKALLPPREP